MATPEALAEEAAATAAEIAAAEAEVHEVEASIEDGADVPFDRVPKLEHRLRLLRTRFRGLGRRRDEASTDRRLGELQQLREVIESEAGATGEQLVEMGTAAYDAMVTFLKAIDAANVRHAGWLEQLRSHGVAGFGGAVVPPPHNAGIGVTGSMIAIDRSRLDLLDVEGAAVSVSNAAKVVANFGVAPPAEEVPFLVGLASIVSEVPDMAADMRFFRNASGTVHAVGEEFIARMPSAIRDMTELSRDEWLAEQWSSAG